MPSVSANLSKSQVADLLAICRSGAVRLNQLANALEQQRPTVKRSEFRRAISDSLNDAQAAIAAARALPGLATAIRKFDIRASRLFEMFQNSFEGMTNSDRTAWHECWPIIERIVSTDFVTLYAKARDLAFDFERLYARARILTDIRPVFDDGRNVIVGTDITQTLRIDYFSSESNANSISIAMDVADIEQLRRACEDALKKTTVARDLIEKNTPLEAALPGEEPNQ